MLYSVRNQKLFCFQLRMYILSNIVSYNMKKKKIKSKFISFSWLNSLKRPNCADNGHVQYINDTISDVFFILKLYFDDNIYMSIHDIFLLFHDIIINEKQQIIAICSHFLWIWHSSRFLCPRGLFIESWGLGKRKTLRTAELLSTLYSVYRWLPYGTDVCRRACFAWFQRRERTVVLHDVVQKQIRVHDNTCAVLIILLE